MSSVKYFADRTCSDLSSNGIVAPAGHRLVARANDFPQLLDIGIVNSSCRSTDERPVDNVFSWRRWYLPLGYMQHPRNPGQRLPDWGTAPPRPDGTLPRPDEARRYQRRPIAAAVMPRRGAPSPPRLSDDCSTGAHACCRAARVIAGEPCPAHGDAAFAANANSRERPACHAQGCSPDAESCLLPNHAHIPPL